MNGFESVVIGALFGEEDQFIGLVEGEGFVGIHDGHAVPDGADNLQATGMVERRHLEFAQVPTRETVGHDVELATFLIGDEVFENMAQAWAEHFLHQQHVGDAFHRHDAIGADAFHHPLVLAVGEFDDEGNRAPNVFLDELDQGAGGETFRIGSFIVGVMGEHDDTCCAGDAGAGQGVLRSRQAFDKLDGILAELDGPFVQLGRHHHGRAMRVTVGGAELRDELEDSGNRRALANDEVVFESHGGFSFMTLVESFQHRLCDDAQSITDEPDADDEARVGDEEAADE